MRLLRNEKGLTLAELLATLAIGSLIIVFIMSIHLLIQKQYGTQKEAAQGLTDITIAVKAITKDIRFAESGKVSEDGDLIFIKKSDDETTYRFENNVLLKNDSHYIYEIEDFAVTKSGDKDRFESGDTITLEIISTTGKEVDTKIIIR